MVKLFKLGNSESVECSSSSTNVINLSKYPLSDTEIDVLNRGLTFVPTPQITQNEIVESVKEFTRKLKIHNYFYLRPNIKNQNKPEFSGKSTWTPNDKNIDVDILNLIKKINDDIKNVTVQKEKSNLSHLELKTLRKLKQNKDIVIKKADKGSSVVIMDKIEYINEGNRQLGNPKHYRQINSPLYLDTAKKITKILQELHQSQAITNKQFKYLAPPDTPRQRRFYMLPKIHKDKTSWPNERMPPGRPIVSDCNSESERIASFIDSFIKTRASNHPSYIKNTYDFLDKISDIQLKPSSLLISLDVESMYTNIEHEDGLNAIKDAFSDYEDDPKFKAILELLEISLKFNDFEFNNKLYVQTSGTAMGRKYAPHYADIYMAKFEKDALNQCPLKPDCYFRYLDDIFIVWSHGREAFNNFLQTFNTQNPMIKFKAEISTDSINFLDTTIFRGIDNKLESKVYFKPTNTHQLLHKSSFHPKHTYKGIVKSQIIRFYRICSRPIHVEEACQILFRALEKRNYPKRWLRKIKNETLRKLNRESRVGDEYPIQSTSLAGSKPCNISRCLTCDIVSVAQNFTSSYFDETYAINSKLDCSSENVIYLYTCKLCHMQYVGETGKSLRNRNNGHRTAINCQNMDDALYSHLVRYHPNRDHSLDLYTLVAIEQVPDLGGPTSNKLRRLEREHCWIDQLCTFEPFGLNIQKYEKFQPFKNKSKRFDLIYVVPFSKTGNASAQIIKKHINLYNKNTLSDLEIAVAYRKHKNLKDILVRSKLC